MSVERVELGWRTRLVQGMIAGVCLATVAMMFLVGWHSVSRWQRLRSAIDSGDVALLRRIIRSTNLNEAPTEYFSGLSPLEHAAGRGNREVAEVLLKNGADPNGGKMTPLAQAALRDDLPMSALLITYGANVNNGANGGWTPLHTAASRGNVTLIRFLLEEGGVVNSQTRDTLATPLHYAAAVSEQAVDVLLGAGAPPNARDWRGCTPLHYAARQNRAEVVRVLLKAGADPAVRNREGESPVQVAINWGSHVAAQAMRDVGGRDTVDSHPCR